MNGQLRDGSRNTRLGDPQCGVHRRHFVGRLDPPRRPHHHFAVDEFGNATTKIEKVGQ